MFRCKEFLTFGGFGATFTSIWRLEGKVRIGVEGQDWGQVLLFASCLAINRLILDTDKPVVRAMAV